MVNLKKQILKNYIFIAYESIDSKMFLAVSMELTMEWATKLNCAEPGERAQIAKEEKGN